MTQRELVTEAVREWICKRYPFYEQPDVNLIKYSENYAFFIQAQDDTQYVLRVNRPEYHRREELLSELLWMQEIRKDTPLVLPKVYEGRDGELLQWITIPGRPGGYTCCLFSFLEGDLLGQGRRNRQKEEMYEIGRILGTLHNQWQYRPKGRHRLVRPHLDLECLVGKESRFGDWHDYRELDGKTTRILERAIKKMEDVLRRFGKGPCHYGMIHADLHRSNIIVKDGVMQLLDFTDCGYGWYLYDLGCTLVECGAEVTELLPALLNGYASIRPLTREERILAPMFVLLRRIVRLGWLATHGDRDTAKLVAPEYFAVTICMAKQFIYQIKV